MQRESIGQKLYRYKIHHVLIWVSYYLFWVLFYKDYYPSLWVLSEVILMYFVFNASSFYITAYYLFPRYLYEHKYGLFAGYFVLVILIATIGLSFGIYWMIGDKAPQMTGNPALIFQVALMAILTMVGGLGGIKLASDKIRADRKAQRQETQRIEAELQYLKAQVNPHFLFNTINSVYFLIKKDPEVAAATLIKLSDLLRFQLYDCSTEKISIEQEIEYLHNYVALEQIRKGEKVKVSFETKGTLSGFYIAPFMLIPFLENAFKYVSGFTGKENKIEIELQKVNDTLKARFFNTRDYTNKTPNGGIGHRNVMRRLELLYHHKHVLSIKERQDSYEVQLELTLI